MEQLKKYIQPYFPVNDDSLNKVLKCFTLKKVKKNTLLLTEGETAKEFHYINKGCLRTYYTTYNGIIKTRHIAFENSMIGALSSFISQKKSYEFVETIENSEIYTIKHNDYIQLFSQTSNWKNFHIALLERGYIFQNRKIESYVTLSAKERYDKLLNEEPHFIERLSNIILASYLDISPETLSRLKSK